MPNITPSASQVDYNIPGGKNTRGLSVLQGVRCLAPSLLDDPELLCSKVRAVPSRWRHIRRPIKCARLCVRARVLVHARASDFS
jgi:hypothetical protein